MLDQVGGGRRQLTVTGKRRRTFQGRLVQTPVPAPWPLYPSCSTTACSAPPGAEGGVWEVRGLRPSTSPG